MTQNTIQALLALGLVAAVALGAFAFGHGTAQRLGGGVNAYQAGIWQFGNGLYAGLTQQFAIDNTGTITSDATVSGGTLNITTSNSATSTIIGGCWQFYATSTATPLKYQASTTPGIMYSQYGSCPNL
jgi:hypothetical protein